jgi:hypothetical protein
VAPHWVYDIPNITRIPSLIFGGLAAGFVIVALVLITREVWRTLTEGEG